MSLVSKKNINKTLMSAFILGAVVVGGCNSGSGNSSSTLANNNSQNNVQVLNTNSVTKSNSDNGNNIVTVYLLIDNLDQLKTYVNDLALVDKANFNRVIFSFVRPTLLNYTSGDLANTGILGFFNGDPNDQGQYAFQQLKDAVANSRAKNIQAFISVGGWNYSCNYPVYGSACGDESSTYDWFPDPNDPDQAQNAKTSYNNIVQLALDLGVDGIDIDYEEFWHADKYAIQWNGNPWATAIAESIGSSPSYKNLAQYGGGAQASGSGPEIMPITIAKLDAILNSLENNPNAKNLMFATAAPPVGARPIMSFVYSDSSLDSVNTYGGLWWGGNLKGLWYNLTYLDKPVVDRIDSLGLMTYDLCDDDTTKCPPYAGASMDLASQVDAYVGDYNNWLKNPNTSEASLTIESNSGKVTFLPAKYNVNPKVQFGFEVNKPAFPRNASGQIPLTESEVSNILAQQATKTNGVIIWQMYSEPNSSVESSIRATAKDTIAKSCATFLKGSPDYDCNADFPHSAPQ